MEEVGEVGKVGELNENNVRKSDLLGTLEVHCRMIKF